VNFRLDLWSAPDDATLRGPQMLSWFAAYDRLVDELTTHGVQVYGQIGAESVPGAGEPDSDDHVTRYAAAFVLIADHFRDRVRVFETFNEPNNWRDATSMRPAVSPLYYAKELQEIYLNTKYYNNRASDPCAQSAAFVSSDEKSAPETIVT
jgi:beta-glucosidase/6-phospho-beta-glucosidase/beta-galactosidase